MQALGAQLAAGEERLAGSRRQADALRDEAAALQRQAEEVAGLATAKECANAAAVEALQAGMRCAGGGAGRGRAGRGRGGVGRHGAWQGRQSVSEHAFAQAQVHIYLCHHHPLISCAHSAAAEASQAGAGPRLAG